ncbi:MAG: hypothetical protein ACXU86_18980 [Archangium sp.]
MTSNMKMKSTDSLVALAWVIAQSATGPNQVIYFIAILLCFSLAQATPLRLGRSAQRITARRRRR